MMSKLGVSCYYYPYLEFLSVSLITSYGVWYLVILLKNYCELFPDWGRSLCIDLSANSRPGYTYFNVLITLPVEGDVYTIVHYTYF